jgi:hypothetical protein
MIKPNAGDYCTICTSLFWSINPGNCTKSSWTVGEISINADGLSRQRNTDQAIFLALGYLNPRVGTLPNVLIKVILCLHQLLPLIVCHRRHRRHLLSPVSIHSPCTRSPVTLHPTPTVILSWTTIAATHHHAGSKITPLLMLHNPPLPYHHTNNHLPNHIPTRHLAPPGYLCHFAKRHHHQTFLMF